MAATADRKYLINAAMLGGFEIGDVNGEFEYLASPDAAGTADAALTTGINNANIISAINSAYAKGAGNEPEGPQYSLQANNPDGTFSGSAGFLMEPIAGGGIDGDVAISINNINSTFSNAGVSTLTGLVTATAGVSVPNQQGLSGLGNLAISVAAGAYDINVVMGDAVGGQRVVFRDSSAVKQATISSDGDMFMSGALDVVGASTMAAITADGAVSFTSTLDVTGDTSVSTFDSTGATTLASGGGAVNISKSGIMTTVAGTLNVDEAVTLDAALDVTGDTSVTTFDSTGATTLASGGGAVNISKSGVMTTVAGTLNVDQAVTLDAALDVTGDTSVTTFDSTGATTLASGGGAVNISKSGVMTTVAGTLNVDQAVTLDAALDVTGDTSVTTFDSTGATTLASGGGAVNISKSGIMTTVAGTLNVDEAVTLDAALTVDGISTLGAMVVTAAGAVSAATTIACTGQISTTSTDGFKLRGTNTAGSPKNYQLHVVGGVLLATESAV